MSRILHTLRKTVMYFIQPVTWAAMALIAVSAWFLAKAMIMVAITDPPKWYNGDFSECMSWAPVYALSAVVFFIPAWLILARRSRQIAGIERRAHASGVDIRRIGSFLGLTGHLNREIFLIYFGTMTVTAILMHWLYEWLEYKWYADILVWLRLLVLLPLIPATMRRLRDIGLSGGWIATIALAFPIVIIDQFAHGMYYDQGNLLSSALFIDNYYGIANPVSQYVLIYATIALQTSLIGTLLLLAVLTISGTSSTERENHWAGVILIALAPILTAAMLISIFDRGSIGSILLLLIAGTSLLFVLSVWMGIRKLAIVFQLSWVRLAARSIQALTGIIIILTGAFLFFLRDIHELSIEKWNLSCIFKDEAPTFDPHPQTDITMFSEPMSAQQPGKPMEIEAIYEDPAVIESFGLYAEARLQDDTALIVTPTVSDDLLLTHQDKEGQVLFARLIQGIFDISNRLLQIQIRQNEDGSFSLLASEIDGWLLFRLDSDFRLLDAKRIPDRASFAAQHGVGFWLQAYRSLVHIDTEKHRVKAWCNSETQSIFPCGNDTLCLLSKLDTHHLRLVRLNLRGLPPESMNIWLTKQGKEEPVNIQFFQPLGEQDGVPVLGLRTWPCPCRLQSAEVITYLPLIPNVFPVTGYLTDQGNMTDFAFLSAPVRIDMKNRDDHFALGYVSGADASFLALNDDLKPQTQIKGPFERPLFGLSVIRYGRTFRPIGNDLQKVETAFINPQRPRDIKTIRLTLHAERVDTIPFYPLNVALESVDVEYFDVTDQVRKAWAERE